MKKYAVYGVGGYGREVLPLVRHRLKKNLQTSNWDLVFVDDLPCEHMVNGHRVLTYDQWLAEPGSGRYINVAIDNGEVRRNLVHRCIADSVEFYEVRASNVVQLDDVQLGVGAVLSPFVMLTSNIRIGIHFHANIYSYVAHDCVIGDYVTFAPGVKCNGNVRVEDHAYIGTGAVIKQGMPGAPLVIGRGAVVGMGAVVTKSVPPGVTVVGNPARPLIKN